MTDEQPWHEDLILIRHADDQELFFTGVCMNCKRMILYVPGRSYWWFHADTMRPECPNQQTQITTTGSNLYYAGTNNYSNNYSYAYARYDNRTGSNYYGPFIPLLKMADPYLYLIEEIGVVP